MSGKKEMNTIANIAIAKRLDKSVLLGRFSAVRVPEDYLASSEKVNKAFDLLHASLRCREVFFRK